MFDWPIWTHWQFPLAKVKQSTHAKSLRIKKFGAVAESLVNARKQGKTPNIC